MTTTATATKITLTREADTTARGNRPGSTVTLAAYTVLLDGVKVGRVFQHRAETMQRYSGRMYGYTTSRTCWAWESEDNMGDYEIGTRKAAVADLIDAVTR